MHCATLTISHGVRKGRIKLKSYLLVTPTDPVAKFTWTFPMDDHDLNAQYAPELKKLSTKLPKGIHVASEEKQDHYYRRIRSGIVLLWIFSNLILVKLMLNAVGVDHIDVEDNPGTQRSIIYMTVVLWSVAGLSLLRSVGAMCHLVARIGI
jgi:chitin synthase